MSEHQIRAAKAQFLAGLVLAVASVVVIVMVRP